MTSKETAAQIERLKRNIEEIKKIPNMQFMLKAARIETVVTDAVFILEQITTETARLEQLLDDFLTNGPNLAA